MKLQIRRDPFESPRPVKYNRAEPCGMRTRTHDRHVAFMPLVLEICPGFRYAASSLHQVFPLTCSNGYVTTAKIMSQCHDRGTISSAMPLFRTRFVMVPLGVAQSGKRSDWRQVFRLSVCRLRSDSKNHCGYCLQSRPRLRRSSSVNHFRDEYRCKWYPSRVLS